MAFNYNLIYFIVLINLNLSVSGSNSNSLTFIIDDTSSMGKDIDRVKVGATEIFKTVLSNRKVSQIEHFILVTFNDNSFNSKCNDTGTLRAKTKDESTFMTALNAINVTGGAIDCAECSMAGIKRGIEESLPRSELYILTDASAKDYGRYEEVKKLALTKQCQIVFVLTGLCTEDTPNSRKYQVYEDLAQATGGNVFHIDKNSVDKVLEYVKLTLTGRMVKEVSKVKPGTSNITVNADPLMGEILFSLSSKDINPSSVSITGPDGGDVWKKVIFEEEKSKAYAFNPRKIGPHTIQVLNSTEAEAVVSAKSGVDYDYGFSSIKLQSLLDSSTLPMPGAKTHLLINLNQGNITLKNVKLLGSNDKIMRSLPLEQLNKSSFYTTKEFVPPTIPFKIAIVGYHPQSDSVITRTAPTSVEPIKVLPGETIINKPPTVLIEGGSKVSVDYNERLTLLCKVEAYPAPTVVWIKANKVVSKKVVLSGKNFPYSYINELVIERVREINKYFCEASNSLGSDSNIVIVEINRKIEITNSSETNITVEYQKEASMFCEVTAYPFADITWYKDGNIIMAGDNVKIISSRDSSITHSTLIIKECSVTDEGNYTCEAKYDDNKRTARINLSIVGLEAPKIDKLKENVILKQGSQATLECNILQGQPKPSIKWFFKSTTSTASVALDIWEDQEQIVIYNADESDSGTYQCIAENVVAKDIHHLKLFVRANQEPPQIDKSFKPEVSVKRGSSTKLKCKILKGNPKPVIYWFFRSNKDTAENFNSILEWNDMETVTVDTRIRTNSGTYKCQVENDNATDSLEIKLLVEYPAKILSKTGEHRILKPGIGSETFIPCNVDGIPVPTVTWFRDDEELHSDGRPYRFDLRGLTFVANTSNTGIYTCKAKNKYGSDSKTVQVIVTDPAIILSKASNFSIPVGSSASLFCQTKGYPAPSILWYYQSFSNNSKTKRIHTKTPASLFLRNIQTNYEGKYTCVARNIGGFMKITYGVQVMTPASIVDKYIKKRFDVVRGDLALQINCTATGNPKPTITWTKDGSQLVLGSTYSIENGKLIIKNIPKNATGFYKCEAENLRGKDQYEYEVLVSEYPPKPKPLAKVLIELGQTKEIECPLPHKNSDQLRWYKKDKLIESGELLLIRPSANDSGLYYCRVSTPQSSYSGCVEVLIGLKPKFVKDEQEIVNMEDSSPVSLNCESDGLPEGNVTWYHDGQPLEIKDPIYFFPEGIKKPGEYKCEVQNIFGIISRKFTATPKYCVIRPWASILKTEQTPLILNSNLTWFTAETSEDNLILPISTVVIFFCPRGFTNFMGLYVTSFCHGSTKILIMGREYDYSYIICKGEIKSIAQRTGTKCLPGSEAAEKIQMTYESSATNLIVFEICMNTINQTPVYAKQIMSKSLAEEDYQTEWFNSDQFDVNLEEAYECRNQIEFISKTLLDKWFHNEDECCFSKKQLVSPRDIFPGQPQKATYSYFNTVPHWSTCGGTDKNWNDVGYRVRNLAKNMDNELLVWTGVAEQLQLENNYGTKTDIFITDSSNKWVPVPLFLWKVIQDPSSSSSLAVVQVNVPDLNPGEASAYIRCEDVCDRVAWMRNPDWRNVTQGFTYCCNLKEFENAFGFKAVFEPNMYRLL